MKHYGHGGISGRDDIHIAVEVVALSITGFLAEKPPSRWSVDKGWSTPAPTAAASPPRQSSTVGMVARLRILFLVPFNTYLLIFLCCSVKHLYLSSLVQSG